MENVDAVIVGAGVIGLAIAARLSKIFANVIVIDKNKYFGEETSSRNSEVIHAGIYYPPKNLKAKLCVEGKRALYEYCQIRNVPYNRIGKLIIAQNTAQENRLEQLMAQASENGVDDLLKLSKQELHRFSPQLMASAGIISPSTGIIDSHRYMQSLLAEAESSGAYFVANTEFISAVPDDKGFVVRLNTGNELVKVRSRYLINSAGLHCMDVARNIEGLSRSLIPELHWCKGHYFSYSGKSPFSRLVYPVPEHNIKGLGIHATIDMNGQLKFGPDTHYLDSHFPVDYQVSSDLKPKFIEAISQYFPNVDLDKLHPSYAGIRPKLQGAGDKFEDFKIEGEAVHSIAGLINLYGIESPGLTASLAIAQHVASLLELDG